jgi:ATP-dependent Clp protease ATP-binding subunit ClpB
MEEVLGARVIGQPEAVKAISNCLRISRAGLHSHERPLGTFLFLGPTGMSMVVMQRVSNSTELFYICLFVCM